MPRSSRDVCFIGLAALLFGAAPGHAAQHLFSGQWSEAGKDEPAIGIIQYGETVAIFGKAGWSMAVIEPETSGILAYGDGKWTLEPSGPSVAVNIEIGERYGHLYVFIQPKEAGGASEVKMIMERFWPPVFPRKM